MTEMKRNYLCVDYDEMAPARLVNEPGIACKEIYPLETIHLDLTICREHLEWEQSTVIILNQIILLLFPHEYVGTW